MAFWINSPNSIFAQLYLHTTHVQRILPNIVCLYLTRLLLTHGLKSVLGEYLENANKTRENRQNFHKLMVKLSWSTMFTGLKHCSNTNVEYTVAFVVCNNACNEMTRISNLIPIQINWNNAQHSTTQTIRMKCAQSVHCACLYVKYYRTHKLCMDYRISMNIFLWKTIGRVKCGHLVVRKRKRERSNDPLV